MELQKQRLEICYTCPLYSTRFGGFCNNKLYYDPKTGKVDIEYHPNWIKGCGCVLQTKTKNAASACPLSKW